MLDKFSGVGGPSMGLFKSIFKSVLLHVLLLLSLVLMVGAPGAAAQDKPGSARAHAKKSVSGERQSRAADPGETAEGLSADKSGKPEDESDLIRKRAEWFYKQRSSANGHIPAGARLKAFQHLQRMMAAEGKLVLRPDGTYAAAAQAGAAVGGAWSSIGPKPTTGGFFSPVSGRKIRQWWA